MQAIVVCQLWKLILLVNADYNLMLSFMFEFVSGFCNFTNEMHTNSVKFCSTILINLHNWKAWERSAHVTIAEKAVVIIEIYDFLCMK